MIPKCDVLAIAGDISNFNDTEWFSKTFLPYISEYKNKFDVCMLVFGNHDDEIPNKVDVPEYIRILANKATNYKGYIFYGSPNIVDSPVIKSSIYSLSEKSLKKIYQEINQYTDVLITHMPPYGFGDTVINQSYHLGSMSLMEKVRIIKPKIHIFGHIHTGKKYTKENGTSYINASVVNEEYRVSYKPTIINL